MRTQQVNSALETLLTRERLSKYLEASNNDLDAALQLYEENTKLSEAFYTPLQALEVSLRNALHARMSATFDGDWLRNGKPKFTANSRTMIDEAVRELEIQLKGAEVPVGSIVAELKFSFWVGLMGPDYDSSLWRQTLYKAFLGSRTGKKRSEVHGRFNALRRHRNRVMHHEPIFKRPLQQLHDEIIDAIGWICPHTAAWTAHQSRFDEVLSGQPQPVAPATP